MAFTTIKEINLNCHLLNQNENNTYTSINNKIKDQIIKEQKLDLSKHKTNLTNIMENEHVMHWIQKIHKTPISFHFIVTFPVYSIKPISKDITSTL